MNADGFMNKFFALHNFRAFSIVIAALPGSFFFRKFSVSSKYAAYIDFNPYEPHCFDDFPNNSSENIKSIIPIFTGQVNSGNSAPVIPQKIFQV